MTVSENTRLMHKKMLSRYKDCYKKESCKSLGDGWYSKNGNFSKIIENEVICKFTSGEEKGELCLLNEICIDNKGRIGYDVSCGNTTYGCSDKNIEYVSGELKVNIQINILFDITKKSKTNKRSKIIK